MAKPPVQRMISGLYEAGMSGGIQASQYWAKMLADNVVGSNRDLSSLLTTLDDMAYSWTAPKREDTP